MVKILENIFSIKNDNFHRIITLLGFKLKFINRTLLYQNGIQKLQESITQIAENNIDSQVKMVKFLNQIDNKILSTNYENSKKWIIDNLNNPLMYDVILDIYNKIEEMKARKLYPIYRNRLSIKTMEVAIKTFNNRYPNHEGFIFSDIDGLDSRFKVHNKDEIKNMDVESQIAILAYSNDYLALDIIDELNKYNVKYYAAIQSFPHARYFHTDKNALKVLDEESNTDSWHFCPVDFENIFQALRSCKNIEGDYVEIGTFRGDSASAALNYMQKENINKKAYFLDTYEGFNYDEAFKSNDTYWKAGHTNTSFEDVQKRLSKYKNANVIKSNIIIDELPQKIEKIAIANIDVDLYEAVKAALYKVHDRIVQNGIIIAEDYGHTPTLIGGQKAVDEFIKENEDKYISIYMNSGQMFLIKR